MSKYMADIVQSAMCKTFIIPRPMPSIFFFPGLHAQPLYENKHFEFTNILKKRTSIIIKEYEKWHSKPSTVSDYKLKTDEHTLHKGSWEWSSYIMKGVKQTEFAVNCPETTLALESVPGLMHSVPFSYAFFSTLKKNSQIAPHTGPCNIRLRCHLPLVVPDGDCGMNIGGHDIKWKVGEPIIFDDCYEHYVWNNTDQDRVVLLFDIWHPSLHPEEVTSIEEMFRYAKDQGWGSGKDNKSQKDDE